MEAMSRRDTPDLRAMLSDEVLANAVQARDVGEDAFHRGMKGRAYGPEEHAELRRAGWSAMRDVLVAALTARPAENTSANLRTDETRDSIVMAAETMRELCAQAIERAMRVKEAMPPDASECATIVRNFKIQDVPVALTAAPMKCQTCGQFEEYHCDKRGIEHTGGCGMYHHEFKPASPRPSEVGAPPIEDWLDMRDLQFEACQWASENDGGWCVGYSYQTSTGARAGGVVIHTRSKEEAQRVALEYAAALKRMRNAPPTLDAEGPATASQLKQLLSQLPDLFAPEIRLEDDGEIGFDWDQGSDCVLSLSLNESTGMVGWSALFPAYSGHGRCEVAKFSDELRDVLTRYGEAETAASLKRAARASFPPGAGTWQPHYSGTLSTAFWDLLTELEGDEGELLLYTAGCALQDHEARMMQMIEARRRFRSVQPPAPPTPTTAQERDFPMTTTPETP